VSGLIQRELSYLLLAKIKDPRLNLVTITAVKVTNDLRAARVYVTVPQGKERTETVLSGFESALGFLRHELGSRLGLKYTPTLTFIYDESFDRADELNRVLKSVKNGQDWSDEHTRDE
jgi:ribosome-binding factor A